MASSSIIRPGVSDSGMKKEFIVTQRNPEKRKETNPILLEIVPETYGVIGYQEDVLKVANQYTEVTFCETDS